MQGGLISFFISGFILSYLIGASLLGKVCSIGLLKKVLHLIGVFCVFPFLIVLVSIFRGGPWPGGWVNLAVAGGAISFVLLAVCAAYAIFRRQLGSRFYLSWLVLILVTNYSLFIIIILIALIRIAFHSEAGAGWL